MDWMEQVSGDTDGWDYPWSTDIDPTGNVYVTGHVSISTGSNWNCTTIKWDPNGNMMWTRNYHTGTPELHDGRCILVDGDDVYVGAKVYNGSSDRDLAIIKYDTDGNFQWVYTFNGAGDMADYPLQLAVHENGYLYVLGSSYLAGDFKSEYLVLKLNKTTGSLLASNYFDSGNETNYATDMVLTDDYVFVSGWTGTTNNDIYAVRYDLDLNQQLVEHIDYSPDDFYPYLAASDLNELYLATETPSGMMLAKYDYNFSLQWTEVFSNVNACILLDSNRDVIIGGRYHAGFDYLFVAKVSPAGNTIWQSTRNSSKGSVLAVDYNDNILIAGDFFSGGNEDRILVIYSSNGQLLDENTFDTGGSNEGVRSIATDGNGLIYVAGDFLSGSNVDWTVTKYTYISVGIANQEVHEMESDGPSIACYPQPFSEAVTISLDGISSDIAVSVSSIDIYDLSGTLVQTLEVSGSALTGEGVLWNSEATPPGVYYCVINAGDQTLSQKLLKIQ